MKYNFLKNHHFTWWFWWRCRSSIPVLRSCKARALPTELHPLLLKVTRSVLGMFTVFLSHGYIDQLQQSSRIDLRCLLPYLRFQAENTCLQKVLQRKVWHSRNKTFPSLTIFSRNNKKSCSFARNFSNRPTECPVKFQSSKSTRMEMPGIDSRYLGHAKRALYHLSYNPMQSGIKG